MQAVRDKLIASEIFSRFDGFRPKGGAVYLHGESVEERSRHSPEWEAANPDVRFVQITSQNVSSFEVQDVKGQRTIQLRSATQLAALWQTLGSPVAYLDMTGLDHSTWAPLVVAAAVAGIDLRVVYIEPREYAYSRTPTEGEIFDLSVRIRGVMPIPGLATLVDAFADSVFIPLLGFEGTRLAYILEHVQPARTQIVPIVGVPGFRPEYPFHAYLGNAAALRETHAWQNVRYARANCPFSLWYVLNDLAKIWPGKVIKIAPIGTKPHALGAVLFWMTHPEAVELVYDHPVRKNARTAGTSRTSVFHIGALGPYVGGARRLLVPTRCSRGTSE